MKNSEFKLPPFFIKTIILCAIVGLTIFFYWNIQDHQFLNFDDDVYVSSNPYVNNGFSLGNIKWTFTFTGISYWHPLTLLSHMLDCQLFGVKPGPHLLVNLSIHIFNALLLFLIISRMTGAQVKAAFIALLFALHPLNVESVAWLVERKTVLSTLFLFGAIYRKKDKVAVCFNIVPLCMRLNEQTRYPYFSDPSFITGLLATEKIRKSGCN